ncbi:hypothetical protein [Ureibacillus manganicus]|uniref:hypothetical protein n=1 Tax=Ureibacillus manganicus TaxID=1266064 RepID=UPI00068D7AF3|nr:hypothetical protein [Ureibacillus manganicus]
MKIETQLAQLFEVIMQEVRTNNVFAEKVRGIFNGNEEESHQISGSRGRRKDRAISTISPDENTSALPSSTTSKKSTRKRNAALFNPETLLEQCGESELLDLLNQLEVDQLKDIVSEYGMDPGKRVMRWRKKENLVNHIVEVADNRLKKGSAFRKI